MKEKQQRCLSSYIEYFQAMNKENVDSLKSLVTQDVYFRDPFNETKGAEPMLKVFQEIFVVAENPRFFDIESLSSGEQAYLKWRFSCYPKSFFSKQELMIEGVSELRISDDGLIESHIDYWDAASQVYQKLPIIGFLLRFIRSRFEVREAVCGQ